MRCLAMNGHLHHSGYDFDHERRKLLGDIPGLDIPTHASRLSRVRNPVMRMLLAGAAFIKSSLRSQARHLVTQQGTLAYVRIPRAASTSFCTTILKTRFPGLPWSELSAEQRNALADIAIEGNLPPEAEVFTVVRNPFARIVSVYRQFFENRTSPFLYIDYLFGILQRDLSFPSFVKTISVIPDTLKDQHFRAQHHLLRYYDKRDVAVKIFRLEDSQGIGAYLGRWGLSFEHVNGGLSYDYTAYYDKETLAAVHALYEADIRRFGYEEVYAGLKSVVEQRTVRK